MSTTPGAGQRRRTRIRATLLAAGAVAFLVPTGLLQTGSAAQLKVSAAPIQTWTLAVQQADLALVPELDAEDPATSDVDEHPDADQPTPPSQPQPGGADDPSAGRPEEAPSPESPVEVPPAPAPDPLAGTTTAPAAEPGTA